MLTNGSLNVYIVGEQRELNVAYSFFCWTLGLGKNLKSIIKVPIDIPTALYRLFKSLPKIITAITVIYDPNIPDGGDFLERKTEKTKEAEKTDIEKIDLDYR